MASSSRRQIESWMKMIEVSGSVIDIGGLFMPAKGRTKTWDVTEYKILDVKKTRNGVNADLVLDLNQPTDAFGDFDHAFCIEVTDHFWDPYMAFKNIARFVKKGGKLYVSSNFLFPHHTGFDCIRFTRTGLEKVLTETGFDVFSVTPRYAVDPVALADMQHKESKAVYHPGEIGYMIKATKR